MKIHKGRIASELQLLIDGVNSKEQAIEEIAAYIRWREEQLATPAVSKSEGLQGRELLMAYFKWHKEMGFVSHKPEDIDEFLSLQ